MSDRHPSSEACGHALRQMDLYLDRELSAEAVQPLHEHLAGCPACAAELRTREQMRLRLRQAVHNAVVPASLEFRVREQMRQKAAWWTPMRVWAAAAVLVLGIFSGVLYRAGLLPGLGEREHFISQVTSRVPSLLRIGLGDHIHCAFFRNFPKTPPPVAELRHSLGPEYQTLIPIVERHAPADFRLFLAHQCRYRDRRFAHLALKKQNHLISLVITRKREGELLTTARLVPALVEAGIPIYAETADQFQVATFEAKEYLVYVISDLPANDNQELARSLAPQVINAL